MELLSNTSDNCDNDSDDELIIDPNISFKSNSESDCDTQWGEVAKEIDLNVDANVVVIFFTHLKTKVHRKT